MAKEYIKHQRCACPDDAKKCNCDSRTCPCYGCTGARKARGK